jgi:hypothetical protein
VEREFSLYHCVLTDSGLAQPPIQWLPEVKQPEHDADLSPLNTMLRVFPDTSSRSCAYIIKHGNNFTGKIRRLTGIQTPLTEGFLVLLRRFRKVEY